MGDEAQVAGLLALAGLGLAGLFSVGSLAALCLKRSHDADLDATTDSSPNSTNKTATDPTTATTTPRPAGRKRNHERTV